MVRWRRRGRRLLRVRTAVTAAGVAGMLAISLAGIGPASAANRAPSSSAPQTTTKDYTCHKQGEGIYTCQWLRQTLEKQPPFYDFRAYDFKTWASMKYGTANRVIIQIVLQYRHIGGRPPYPQRETGLPPVKGGNGTISAYLSRTLCTYEQYRPKFEFKYFEGKPANKWIHGWSYGSWYNAPAGEYCNNRIGLGVAAGQ
jgi:hypothetical protein